MDEFAIGRFCVIVVAVDLNQADSCPHAIHIVVQASVLFHNAILDLRLFRIGIGVGSGLGFGFRIRCGIHGRRIDHLAGLIERILSDRKQTVGQGDPVGSALYSCTGTGAEIVVVPIQQNQAGSLYQITVFDQISVAVFLCMQAAVVFLPYAIAVKQAADHLGHASILMDLQVQICDEVSIRLLSGIILAAVDLHPAVHDPLAGPLIMCALCTVDQRATGQNVVCKRIFVSIDGPDAIHCFARHRVKVVVVIRAVGLNDTPSGFKYTIDRIIQFIVQLKQPSQLSGIDAIFAKVIVILVVFILIAGQLLDAGERLVVLEIIDVPVKGNPAVFNGFIQRIAVRKGAEGGGKMAATGMGGIFRLGIRINTILLLEGFLAGHGVKRISTQVDVIADITAVCQRQAVIFIPCRVILRSQRNAADNDNGVSSLGADRLALLDPVDGKGQRVRCLIQLCIAQGEIVIHDLQIGVIDRRILIECNLHLHICLAADTLGKLQQDIPCGDIIQIASRHHGKQRNKLFGDLHFLHIQCKGVLGHHGQIGFVDIVGVGSDVILG